MPPHQTEINAVYRFNRYPTFLILGAVLAIVPIQSMIELISNGSIDIYSLGSGRIRIPYWVTLGIIWPVFLYFSVFFAIPAMKTIARGFVFKIDGHTIRVGEKSLRRNEIISCKKSAFGGYHLITKNDSIHIIPELNTEGTQGLRHFLGESSPLPS